MAGKIKLRKFIFGTLFLLSVVAGFVFFIDPYGYSGRNQIGIFFGTEREFKSGWLISNSFDGVILGSSKVSYFNPDNHQEFKIFNAGFGAARPEEILYLLRDAKPNIDFILLGIDLFMFNEKTFPFKKATDFPFHGFRGYVEYLFSWDMLCFSFKALDKYRKGAKPSFRKNGSRFPEVQGPRDKTKFEAKLAEVRRTLTYDHYNFGQEGLSKKRIQAIREIRDLARQRNIQLVVWINPYQQEVLNLVMNTASIKIHFVELRKVMQSIFPDILDLSAAFPDSRYYYTYDPYHYLPETADLIYDQHLLPRIHGQRKHLCVAK